MKGKYSEIKVDKIIKKFRNIDGGWSWTKYIAGPYLGCSFGCAYCYNLENGEDDSVTIKHGAVDKFRRELKELPKDVITLGDYQPAEAGERLLRAMLKIVAENNFPLHIIEKSPLVVDDIDIIKQISQNSWAAISVSVTSSPDDPDTSAGLNLFEPGTATATDRFKIMSEMSKQKILTGAYCVPVIPFIGDSANTIEAVIKSTKEAGGKYFILGGLVIPEPFDQLFWKTLKDNFPKLESKVKELYDINNSAKYLSYLKNLEVLSTKLCDKYGLWTHIPRPINHYPKKLRPNKSIAEYFYLKSRFARSNGLSIKMEDAYLALAFLLDNLDYNICHDYQKQDFKALEDLGLTVELAKELEGQIRVRL